VQRRPAFFTRRSIVISVFIAIATAIPPRHATAQPPPTTWAVRGVTLIDVQTGTTIQAANIVIPGQRIACAGPTGTCTISPGAEVLDRSGHYAIPGLWNSHAHLTNSTTYLFLAETRNPTAVDELRRAILRIYLAAGVTGLVLLADDPDRVNRLRKAETSGELPSPRLFSCGWGISYPGSWNDFGGAATPRTPREGRAAVRRQATDDRVDCIKLTIESGPGPVTTRPRLPAEVAAAIVEEAHRLSLVVYAHATHAADVLDAVEAGVDVIVHAVADTDSAPEELRDAFIAQGTYYNPTLVLSASLFRYFDQPLGLDEPALRRFTTAEMQRALRDSVRQARFLELLSSLTGGAGLEWARTSYPGKLETTRGLFAAGVKPVLGTDPVFFVVPGDDIHRELELLVEAGLTPAQALRAATLNAARALGREADFGTIEVGKYADFVVLEGNPLDDITQTRNIDFVVKGGQLYNASALLSTLGTGG
jgi:imidazolonepropionase-like amidohydrolase